MKSILVIHVLVPLAFVPAALAVAGSITGELHFAAGIPLSLALILLPFWVGISATRMSPGVCASIVSVLLMLLWLPSWISHPGVAFRSHPLQGSRLFGHEFGLSTPALIEQLAPLVWTRLTWPTVVAFLTARLWGAPEPPEDRAAGQLRSGSRMIAVWGMTALLIPIMLATLAMRWGREVDLAADRSLELSRSLVLLGRPFDVEHVALKMASSGSRRGIDRFRRVFVQRHGHGTDEHTRLTEALLALAHRRDLVGNRATRILTGERGEDFSCGECMTERSPAIDRFTRQQLEEIDSSQPQRERNLLWLRLALGQRGLPDLAPATTVEWIREHGARADVFRREQFCGLVRSHPLLPTIPCQTPKEWNNWFHRYGKLLVPGSGIDDCLILDPSSYQQVADVIQRLPGRNRGSSTVVLVCPEDAPLDPAGERVVVRAAITIPGDRLGKHRSMFLAAKVTRLELVDGMTWYQESPLTAPVAAARSSQCPGPLDPMLVTAEFSLDREAIARRSSRRLVIELAARDDKRMIITSEVFRLAGYQ